MKTIKAMTERSEQNTAAALSSIGSLAMMAPYPYGGSIGASLSLVGGFMSLFGEKDKTDEEKAVDSLGSKIEAIAASQSKISEGLTKIDLKLYKAFKLRKSELTLINISARALAKS